MENPKISVSIPVYNGEKTLRKCLFSVLNQSYKNYEVIVIDNCSTDKTREIVKEFQRGHKRLYYKYTMERGRGAARNEGIKNAKGKVIAMTDADCMVPNDWIEKLVKPITEENEDVVMGFQEDDVKNFWTKNVQQADWNFVRSTVNGKYINHLDTKNFAIKSSILEQLMFDQSLQCLEDFELYLRLKEIANIRFVPEISVKHNHKWSFTKIVALNFSRGFWAFRVARKHNTQLIKGNEKMTESISFKNFLAFPFWLVLQFIKKPVSEAYYILISETSWRVGILWSLVKK